MATPDGGGAVGGLPSPFDDSVAMALQTMALQTMAADTEPSEGVPPGGSAGDIEDRCKEARATPRWIPSSEASCCMLCQKDFSKLRVPRHHCRRCGWAVCGSCSTHVLKLDRWLDSEKPHTVWHTPSPVLLRVCDSCHAHSLEGRADAAARASAGVGSDDWRLRRAFEVIDLDNSGCISWVELSFALRGGVEPSGHNRDEAHAGFTNIELDDIMKRARAASGTERLYMTDFLTLCEEEPAMRVILSNAASVADASQDPWSGLPVHDCPEMPAVRKFLATADYEADVLGGQEPIWTSEDTSVKMEIEPFAEGAMRHCFRCLLQLPSGEWRRMVAKQYKQAGGTDGEDDDIAQSSAARLEEDVRMQTGAKEWAHRYNERSPRGAKRVDFLQSFLLEVKVPNTTRGIRRSTRKVFYLEAFVQGQYVKHSSNAGFVGSKIESSVRATYTPVGSAVLLYRKSSKLRGRCTFSQDGEGGDLGYLRWTPQAFSHFTFDASAGRQLIVDIQGVGDLYTDPAVHSADQQGFGSGNMGPDGMLSFFLTHQCTPLCQSLGLQPFFLHDAEKPDSKTVGEILLRVGSCGESLASSAVECGSHHNHEGVEEALGKLHTKLALHYVYKHLQGNTNAAAASGDDALSRATARLSESDRLSDGPAAYHAVTAAAYLRRLMSSGPQDDPPLKIASETAQRQRRWLEAKMKSAAQDAQESMDHFDVLLRDYTKTDEICALREKWAAYVRLLDGSSQSLGETLSGASPTYLKLVAKHEVMVHEVRAQIEAVYRQHRKEKLGDVERLLQEWRGSEQLLLQEIQRKYCDSTAMAEMESDAGPEPEPEVMESEPEPEDVVSELASAQKSHDVDVGLLASEPEPIVEPQVEQESQALPEPEIAESWLELCAATDIGAAFLLWCGEDAEVLPESFERLKYPTLSDLAAVEHVLGHCSTQGASAARGQKSNDDSRLHLLIQKAEATVGRDY